MTDLDLDLDLDITSTNTNKLNPQSTSNLQIVEESKTETIVESNTSNKPTQIHSFSNENTFNLLKQKADQLGVSLPNDFNPNQLNDLLLNFSNMNFPQMTDNSFLQQGPLVSWRDEALKGNFMPAIVLLKRNKIQVNEISDFKSESRLIHQAVLYSYLNVSRTLIEKFNSDVNIKTKLGHSPLHTISNNTTKDLFLLCYFLNLNQINIDSEDNSKVTPLFYASLTNFNEAVVGLVSKGANLSHVDAFGNTISYLCLVSGNLFAMRLAQAHDINFDINRTYQNNGTTLSEVLISAKDTSICKYLMEYNYKEVSTSSIISSNKSKETFKELNVFNYELMRTVYFYKCYWVFSLLFLIYKILCGSYMYKSYMFSFMVYNLIVKEIRLIYKYLILIIYAYMLITLNFDYLKRLIDLQTESVIFFFLKSPILLLLYTFISISILYCILKSMFVYIKLLFGYDYDLIPNENISSDSPRNIINQYKYAISSNPLKIPIINEFCEVCLINKDHGCENIDHCFICKSCKKGYHFHSHFLGICISYNTALLYFLVTFTFFLILYINLYFEFKIGALEQSSLLKSDFLLFNFFIFLSNVSFPKLVLIFYSFIHGGLFLQFSLSVLIPIGSKSTYTHMFNMHLNTNYPLFELRDKKKNAQVINKGVTVSWSSFIYNIFKFES